MDTETLKLEKARKRREYLTTYQRIKYQTDPEYRQKTIDKVLARYRKRKYDPDIYIYPISI